jgi:hypothetical protein
MKTIEIKTTTEKMNEILDLGYCVRSMVIIDNNVVLVLSVSVYNKLVKNSIL